MVGPNDKALFASIGHLRLGQVEPIVAIACRCMSSFELRKMVRSSRRKTADKLPDAGENRLLIAGEGPVIGAVELDKLRLRDVAGEMPAGADANGAVTAAVEHESRRGNFAQKMPHIRIAQRLEQALHGSRARSKPAHHALA
jgi:hypothetical protein